MGLFCNFEKHTHIRSFIKVPCLLAYFESLGLDTDNREPFYIGKNDIINLIDRCKKIIENPKLGKELLPNECINIRISSTYGYGEEYLDDINNILDFCINVLLPKYDNLTESDGIYFTFYI